MRINRHFFIPLIAVLLCVLVGCNKGNYYKNPLFTNGCYPYAIKYDGEYFFTMQEPSCDHISLWSTSNISSVGKSKKTIVWRPDKKQYSQHIWAPELHRLNGKWYIYFEADDGITDNHHLYVVENSSRNPLNGKFVFKGRIDTDEKCDFGIHPTTIVVGGRQYLLWSGWQKPRVEAETQCIYIALMSNPWTVSSHRVLISKPQYEWERQWINFNGQKSAYPIYVNENPEAFLSRDGRHVIVCYSASGCWTIYYCEGMVYADAKANLLDSTVWKKHPEPLLMMSRRNSIYGPASISLVPSPDNSETFMLYEAKSMTLTGVVKNVLMQKIRWNDSGFPVLGSPKPLNEKMLKPSGTR